MNILDSKVNTPGSEPDRGDIASLLGNALEQINRLPEVKELKDIKSEVKNSKEYTTRLLSNVSSIFNETVDELRDLNKNTLGQAKEITEPLLHKFEVMNNELIKLNQGVLLIKDKPNPDPIDLTPMTNAIHALSKSIPVSNSMEADELRKNLKEIIKLLAKIAAGEWVSQGTTIVGGGNSSYQDSEGNPVFVEVTENGAIPVDIGENIQVTAENTDTLISTLNELNSRLAVLAGMSDGKYSLRVIQSAAGTAQAVTLASTVVSAVTTFGGMTGQELQRVNSNTLVTLANINNVTT